MPKLRKQKKAEEIERVIARLFAFKGYHSTSMRDIACELCMHQSSLYHYFKGKEDILFKLMNDAMDDAMATLEGICTSDLSPEVKLKKVFRFYIQYYAGNKERVILLENEMNSLSKPHRRLLIKKQRHYVNLIRSILKELANQHKIKDIHITIATFAFFGMVNYTHKWYRWDGPIGLEKLADILTDIMTKGILK